MSNATTNKDLAQSVQEFYNQHPFPGPYTGEQLSNYTVGNNRYIASIDQHISPGARVLDVGCGTGFITNLLAQRYADTEFTGIDFSTGVEYAQEFARAHDIQNVQFCQQDLFDHLGTKKYNIIIAMSVLTHIPDQAAARKHLTSLLADQGTLIIGVYNRLGNCIKQFGVDYGNDRLALDQQHCPYELAQWHAQVTAQWSHLELISVLPSLGGHLVNVANLFNARNGGLTLYVFKRR
jgi:SAM-dependent methyltransferase